jgi:hypothetical protein
MVRARLPMRSTASRVLAGLVALFAVAVSTATRAAAVEVSPGPRGHLGAWLALGPLLQSAKASRALGSIDAPVLASGKEGRLAARMGRAVSVRAAPSDGADDGDFAATRSAAWHAIASNDGAIDVGAALGSRSGEAFALLSGVLHLSEPLRGVLFIGASDGVRVIIDGNTAFSIDGRRLARDDQDAIPLDLATGDHPIVVKLHHIAGPWSFRARIVDDTLAPARGAWLRLPGATDQSAASLAGRLANVKVDFGLSEDGFRPAATIAFPEGLVRDTDLKVRVTATVRGTERPSPLFDLDGGRVPTDERGTSDLCVRLPAITPDDLAGAEESGSLEITVQTVGRKFESRLELRRWMREGVKAAAMAIDLSNRSRSPFLTDPDATKTTIENLRDRLVRYAGAGDNDLEAMAADATTLTQYLADLEHGRDPLRAHSGIRRFAYASRLDENPSQFGIYVPPSYDPQATSTYPLVVVLHGMNGKPLSMIRWFFGRDDRARDGAWEDRHPGDVPPIEGFVLAPGGHGNATYRELGEADVMTLVDWAEKFFPIDPNRVTITGASMGGIGAAAIALRFPDRFAASEPLCGYHSYFVRADLKGLPMLAWERWLAEQRSNVLWAENGLHLPMYVWHGKRDFPEKNSQVLIDRYRALGYKIAEEHPNVGHDVWRKAYEGLGGWRWLSGHVRDPHPRSVVFRTNDLRWADSAWVHVRELASDLEFGEVRAKVVAKNRIDVTARAVAALALDRDPELVTTSDPIDLHVNGQTITVPPDVPLSLFAADGGFVVGERAAAPGHKRPRLGGPIRDIYFDPLIFVYGTLDPSHVRANEEVARAWARVRAGVDIHYKVMPDVELDEQSSASHSLVLVGNAMENRIVREIEEGLPFKIVGDAVVASGSQAAGSPKQWRGEEAGVMFIYPNPRHPDRYVLVIEAPSPLGTYRSISAPELLGDFVVYDRSLAGARGQVLLGRAKALAAGLFNRDWSLPDL